MSKQRDEALIRAAIDRATATERERCAAICERLAKEQKSNQEKYRGYTFELDCSLREDSLRKAAAAIRKGEPAEREEHKA